MHFVQINQNKALSAAVELNRGLVGYEEYICLITEPYKNKCKITARPEGSRILYHKSSLPPRAAIFFKGGINLIKIESLCNEDCAVGLLDSGNERMLIASVYLDINKPVVTPWLEEICEHARAGSSSVLLN